MRHVLHHDEGELILMLGGERGRSQYAIQIVRIMSSTFDIPRKKIHVQKVCLLLASAKSFPYPT